MLRKTKTLPEPRSPYFFWNLLSILVIGVMLASVVGSIYFLYTTIYRTLEDAYTVVILESDVHVETVNMDMYTKAQALVALKKDRGLAPQAVPHIFIPRTSARD